MCNAARRRCWLLCGAAFAVLLLGAVGCEDEICEGDDCIAEPLTPDGVDDEDVRALGASCESMCDHVMGDCADSSSWVIDDSADGVDHCMPLCLGVTDKERTCLMSAPCSNLDLCLEGLGRPEDVP